jgi:hypothetical protein
MTTNKPQGRSDEDGLPTNREARQPIAPAKVRDVVIQGFLATRRTIAR